MPKFELTGLQESQLEQRVRDKVPGKTIQSFFKESHNIDMPQWKIGNLRTKLGIKKRESKLKEGPKKLNTGEVSLDKLLLEIVGVLETTRKAYKEVFLALRLEVIKSQNEVFRMKQGLNLPVPKDFDKE